MLKEGNELYQNKEFTEAINKYETIINNGFVSDALYYNLGNSYYRIGSLGKAILNYERGLKLNPNDEDLKFNLNIAKARKIDQIDEVPKLFIVEWWEVLITLFTPSGWSVIVSIFLFGFLVSLALYFTSRSGKVQRNSFLGGAAFCGALILSVILFISEIDRESSSEYGIVLSNIVTVKQSPGEGAEDAFVLHEGTKFSITDNVKEWIEVKLADGKVGWMPMADMEAI